MKKIKTLLLAIFVATLTAFSGNAQKVAHINTEELISSMPEYKALQQKLENLGNSYQEEIKNMENALKTKLQKYDQEASSQTNETNMARQQEVQLEAQKLEQYKATAMQDLQKQEQEGMRPILEKAQKAIEEVANEQNIEYVINASALIVAKGKDLLPDVKAKLGI